MIPAQGRLLTVFTPSDAAARNTNAQNLTVKEVVARLPEDEFHVTMLCEGEGDPRLIGRRNTRLIPWTKHGNAVRSLRSCIFPPPDVYFFPRWGLLDRVFLTLRRRLGLKTALVTYIVMAMDQATGSGFVGTAVRQADMVFGNSAYVVQTIQRMFGVSAAPIYDGVDRRYFYSPPRRVENSAPVALYAGSFQARKRVEWIIQQAARLRHLSFRLAGRGETEQGCRDLAEKLECRNVNFLGHLSPDKLGEEMRHADVFVFPSIQEGNPQVLLQAAACGLSCVAMDLYHSDYVISGKTGYLANSDEELAQSLDRLAADANLRRSFSAAAIEHASGFDWDRISSQWAAAFHEAVARRQSRRPQRTL